MNPAVDSIDSKAVDRALRDGFWPILRERGFERRTGRTAWRDAPQCVQTANVRSFNRYLAALMACTSFSFAINLGVYYPAVAENAGYGPFAKDPGRPAEQHCHARFHMAKGIAQPDPDPTLPPPPAWDARLEPKRWRDRPDVWFVAHDGSNLDEVVADAIEQVVRIGVPWLDRLSDLPEALRTFREEPNTSHAPGIVAEGYAGAPGSPARMLAIEALSRLVEPS